VYNPFHRAEKMQTIVLATTFFILHKFNVSEHQPNIEDTPSDFNSFISSEHWATGRNI
jgi:hypothetical protein